MRVAYLLNIFPKISETFILNEILAMQKKGLIIDVFAYEPSNEEHVHAAVEKSAALNIFTV